MIGRNIVLLDGRQAGDEDLTPAHEVLSDLLEQAGAEVRTFSLRELKLTHCIGCFGCWLETPGVCCFRDAGREIAQAIMESDTVILFAPVSFGGYAPQLKVMVDRFLPTLLPYFGVYHGEVHHRPRYARYPRWVGIGVQRVPDAEEARIYKLVVARNAINFHAPSYAAEVVQSTDDRARLQEALRSALERQDPFPWREPVRSMLPAGEPLPVGGDAEADRRALLIVGSPKTKSPSTSGVLGEELLGRLATAGWQTESLTLKPSTFREPGQTEFLAAVDRADLILVAFPLYIDVLALPPDQGPRGHRRAPAGRGRRRPAAGPVRPGQQRVPGGAPEQPGALHLAPLRREKRHDLAGRDGPGRRRGDPRRTSARGEGRQRHPALPHQPGAGRGRGGTGPR